MPTQKQSADLNLSPSETVSSYEPAVIADGYKPVSIEKTDDASITEGKLNPDPVAGIAPSPLDNVEAMLRNMHASIPAETKENATVAECIDSVSTDLRKISHNNQVALVKSDFFAAASVLQEANLLDKNNKWINPDQKMNALSQDLQRAVIHFKDAENEVKNLPEFKDKAYGKVKNSLEKIAHLELVDQVETELQLAAKALRDGKVLDDMNLWIDPEMDRDKLSPEMQEAVIRYKKAVEAKKNLPVLEEDMNIGLRSLRKLLRSPIESDVKLIVILALAPILIAISIPGAIRNTPSAVNDAISRIPGCEKRIEDDLTESATTANVKIDKVVEAVDKAPEMSAIDEVATTSDASEVAVNEAAVEAVESPIAELEEEYSAVTTPRELAAAIAAAREEAGLGAISKGKSI